MNCNFVFKISALLCIAIGALLITPIFWIKYFQISTQILELLKHRTNQHSKYVDAGCITEWSNWMNDTNGEGDYFLRQRRDSGCKIENERMPVSCPWKENCQHVLLNISDKELEELGCLNEFSKQINNSQPFAVQLVQDRTLNCSLT